MRIRHYIPLAFAVLIVLAVAAQKTGMVPPASVLGPGVVGAILILFQLEDHRLGRFFAELGHAVREAAHLHK
jgi:hypothetical protein